MSKNKRMMVKELLNDTSVIKYNELRDLGVSSSQINHLVKDKVIERVSRGLYTSPNNFSDQFFELQKKYKQVIFSHETAASLLDMNDVTLSKIVVTVPRNYNYQYLVKNVGLKVKRVSKERYDIGIVEIISPFGNKIRVYDRERTICDLISKRNKTEIRILNESIRNYFSSKERNLNKLMKTAMIFKVDKDIRKYMEVLL